MSLIRTPRPDASTPALAAAVALALALALAACGDRPAPRHGFRADTPIYSNAVLDLTQTAGRWTQAAAFAKDPEDDCRSGGASIIETKTGLAILARLCLENRSGLIVTAGNLLRPTRG